MMVTENVVMDDDDSSDNGDDIADIIETTLKKHIATTLREQQKQKLEEAMTMLVDEEMMLDIWISRLHNLQKTQSTSSSSCSSSSSSSFSRSSSRTKQSRVNGRSKTPNNDNGINGKNDGSLLTATEDEQEENGEEDTFLDVTHDWLYVSASDVWNVISQSQNQKLAGDDASLPSTSSTLSKFSAVVIKAPFGGQVQVSKPAIDDLSFPSQKQESKASEVAKSSSNYDQIPQRQLFVFSNDPKNRDDLFVESATATSTTEGDKMTDVHETSGQETIGHDHNDEIVRKSIFLGSPQPKPTDQKKRKSKHSSSLTQYRYKKNKKEPVEVYVLTNHADTNEELSGSRVSNNRRRNNKWMTAANYSTIGMSKLFDDPMVETVAPPEYTLSSPSANDVHHISCLRDNEAISSFF
mmetsp:Transcript_33881/g.81493  ORF Transcript_33881/g.81493 Transcript_33881/m.81493 type:complete len:409 (+) Transcript_33881:450-1676(+)